MAEPIISVSGLRGITGESLTPEIAVRYVSAFASLLPDGPVVVTRDGRASGPELAKTISDALAALKRTVLYGEVAATPTTGVLVRDRNAIGGIQISASHNPAEYNGFKLFGSDGRVISADTGQRVIDRMNADFNMAIEDHQPEMLEDTTSAHLDLIMNTVDVQVVRDRNFSVVLDSNHGAGSVLGRPLLEALGVRLQVLGEQPDGQFQHRPEPTRENLASIASDIRGMQADVVFCQDPDADRLAIITGDGTYVGEEYTLALTMMNRLSQSPGDCVINCATSRMSIDVARAAGCTCHISAVGEAHVCDLMKQVDAVYGGEGNGGPIDPRVGYVRDSFVGMAQTLELMATTGRSISQLVDELPTYSIVKSRVSIDHRRLPEIFEALKQEYREVPVNELDGIRFDWPDRWILIRPSNTEPILRIICEAQSDETAQAMSARAREIISR